MKERPILFSAPMVRALLNGAKTQTRRIAKGVSAVHAHTGEALAKLDSAGPRVRSPYGNPGDRLWVRETWAHSIHAMAAQSDEDGPFVYAATDRVDQRLGEKWKPSIHMPRYACRLKLDVIGVRVERLQDISETDALAEGITGPHNVGYPAYRVPDDSKPRYSCAAAAYEALWEQINGADSWAANPWVWVVEFKRVEGAR